MRNHRNRVCYWILLFSVIILGCNSFGDPVKSLKGIVKNSQNQPVSGASVIVKRKTNGEIRIAALEQTTKEDGIFDFTFTGNVPENSFIVVNKNGFKPYEKDLNLKTDPNNLEVVLESSTK